ncbi:MAG: hypothetical protein ACYS6W_18175 [Planctomycetota bacterium]
MGYYAGYRQTAASNLLIIDNQDRGSVANELAKSLIYGTFDTDPDNQTLRFNAGEVNIQTATRPTLTINDSGVLSKIRLADYVGGPYLYLTTNAYWDGANWQRDDVGEKSALYYVDAAGDHVFLIANPAANPIAALTTVFSAKNDGTCEATGALTAASLIIGDGQNIGSASVPDAIQIEADGDVVFSQNVGIGGTPAASLHVLNEEDNANATIFYLEGKRPTPTNNDTMYIYYRMANDTPASFEYARTTISAEDITTGEEDGSLLFEVARAGTLETVLKMSATEIVLNEPGANRAFRVEASGVPNAISVNGADGAVAMGGSLAVTGAVTGASFSTAGDITSTGGSIYVYSNITHYNDTDTQIGFLANRIFCKCGNQSMFDMNYGAVAALQHIHFDMPIKIKEAAAAGWDDPGYGQLWVKNTTPCELWFTDDAGTDTQIV